jgi:ABC-2 type transporter.
MELKQHRKSILFWCLGIILFIVAGMVKFDSYKASGLSMNEIIGAMPRSIKVLFGFNSMDVSTFKGYYGMLYFYMILMATIHAAILGSNIISKEERDKTSEFLMAKPVTRSHIITSKILAALFNIVVFNMVTLISSILMAKAYGNGEDINKDILILMLGMFISQLLFLSIGTSIAALSKNPKTPSAVSTAILLGTFILSMVIDLNEKLDILKYLTPFKYFEAKNLLTTGGMDGIFVTLSSLIILSLTCVTYIYYKKRDLNV